MIGTRWGSLPVRSKCCSASLLLLAFFGSLWIGKCTRPARYSSERRLENALSLVPAGYMRWLLRAFVASPLILQPNCHRLRDGKQEERTQGQQGSYSSAGHADQTADARSPGDATEAAPLARQDLRALIHLTPAHRSPSWRLVSPFPAFALTRADPRVARQQTHAGSAPRAPAAR